jgi:hypothetical protein
MRIGELAKRAGVNIQNGTGIAVASYGSLYSGLDGVPIDSRLSFVEQAPGSVSQAKRFHYSRRAE